jgi:hypothetical protein
VNRESHDFKSWEDVNRIALAITRASRRARDTRSVTQTVAICTTRTNDTAHAAVIVADRA